MESAGRAYLPRNDPRLDNIDANFDNKLALNDAVTISQDEKNAVQRQTQRSASQTRQAVHTTLHDDEVANCMASTPFNLSQANKYRLVLSQVSSEATADPWASLMNGVKEAKFKKSIERCRITTQKKLLQNLAQIEQAWDLDWEQNTE